MISVVLIMTRVRAMTNFMTKWIITQLERVIYYDRK